MIELIRCSDFEITSDADFIFVSVCNLWITVGIDALLFLTFLNNFEESDLIYFAMYQFFQSNYSKYLKMGNSSSQDGKLLLAKSLQIMSNLRDAVEYPKFSDIDISELRMSDIQKHLNRTYEQVTVANFTIKLYLPSGIDYISISLENWSPSQKLYEEVLEKIEAKAEHHFSKDLQKQYWIFLSFRSSTSNIPLKFDTQ